MSKDIDILNAVAKGDKAAFLELYNLFAPKVYNTAISFIKDIQQAEEITQDVFVSIHKNASRFRAESSVSTWIYRIAVNSSLNYIRKKKTKLPLLISEKLPDTPDFAHPGVVMENKENMKILFKHIDALNESQRTAFILSYIEALPRQEVADIMNTSLKAVESLLQRAKKNLRETLIKLYPNRRK